MKEANMTKKLRDDAGRKQADALEANRPYYDLRGTLVLSLSAAGIAGFVTYFVNGGDVVRAGVAAFIWLAIGWYSGKAVLPRKKASSSHTAGSEGQGV